MNTLPKLLLLTLCLIAVVQATEARRHHDFSKPRIPEWRKVSVQHKLPQTLKVQTHPKPTFEKKAAIQVNENNSVSQPETTTEKVSLHSIHSELNKTIAVKKTHSVKRRSAKIAPLSSIYQTDTSAKETTKPSKEKFYTRSKTNTPNFSYGRIGFWMILGSMAGPFISAILALILLAFVIIIVAAASVTISEGLLFGLLIAGILFYMLFTLIGFVAFIAFWVGTVLCIIALLKKNRDLSDENDQRMAKAGLVIVGVWLLLALGFLTLSIISSLGGI